MASINKLSVRGIRAFSPDDEEQVIAFCKPLTILVGANGCGKTTIIEALKYAITGSLPPGVKSGQAFVHDPKSVGSTTVKAAIKLRFTNRAGNTMVVIRSMELTQKKSTMTFKALDGILRMTDERGQRQSLSHKCSELDRQIPQLLGVPKPILEYVVFCHQEDSSWPLMEGSILKKRFDDIFDSTRYAKALEAIKDTRKEFMTKVKDHKADLNLLQGHKHAANGFRAELDKNRQALSDIADEIQSLDTKIEQQYQQLEETRKILQRRDQMQSEVDAKKAEIEQEEVRIETQRSALQEDLVTDRGCDRTQLENMLKGFHSTMEEDMQRLTHKEKELNELKIRRAKIQQQRHRLAEQRGVLIGEKKNYERDLATRIQLIEHMASKYDLLLNLTQTQTQTQRTYNDDHDDDEDDGTTLGTQQQSISTTTRHTSQDSTSNLSLTKEDMRAFQRSLQAKDDLLNDQLTNHRLVTQTTEDKIQGELGDLMASLKSIENDLKRYQGLKNEAMEELRRLGNTTSFSRIKKSDIDEARRNVEKFSKLRDEANNNPRRMAIPREIKEKQDKIQRLKASIEEDNQVLKQLRQCAEDQNNIQLLKNQVSSDMESLLIAKDDNSFLLQKHDVHPIFHIESDHDELVNTMESMASKVQDKLDTSNDKLSIEARNLKDIGIRLAKENSLLNHTKELLDTKKAKLSELGGRGVQRVKQILKAVRAFETTQGLGDPIHNDIDPQDFLQHLTKRIGEFSIDDDSPESISRTIKKMRKLSKVKDAAGQVVDVICPCCSRSMKPETVRVFGDNINLLSDPLNSPIVKMDQSRLQKSRSAIRNYENWRTTISQNINDCLDYKRIMLEIEGLESTMEERETQSKELQAEINHTTETHTDLETDNMELQQLNDFARRLRDDAIKIADKKRQILSKQEDMALIAPSADGKNLRTLESELTSKTEEKDMLMNAIAELNRESGDINDNISRASNQASRAEKVARDKEERHAQEQKAIARKQELSDSISKHKEEENKLQDQVAPIRQKAKSKESQKFKFRDEAKKEEQEFSNSLNTFRSDAIKINSITKQIDAYSSSNKMQQFDQVDKEVAQIGETLKGIEENLNEMEPKLLSLRARVNDQEGRKKNVESNIELLNMIDDLNILDDELALLKDKIDQLEGVDIAVTNESKINTNIRQYEAEKSRRQGSKETLKMQQRDLKRKLQTPEYNDIDERHRIKMIEVETCNIAVSDLEIYYNALDKALLRFHSMKIEEINKIIQELWSHTYKGEDITNIRLTSDQETGSKARRSYNYRVVMAKGTTELDMRGRCSAGQRVLASIVIRLALAETFCINCGVMALDEPTTNLDYANKRGLAIALAHIISSRAAQENFQLVIITHDEDFVGMMKNELATHTGISMPERYFQVSREEGGDGSYYSKIHAIDWDEL
mmetsp:Transcript_6676/g.9616  ORF Transcript_6676/g.9616 Transcript_6676/m.9616 type:complete len:1419 (+) Transcript_6676:37-4293(+)